MDASVAAKQRAAGLSLGFNVLSTIVKFAAATVTGSVSLLSEAFHSATDILTSGMALASVRAAAAPPDEEHPFGHGKIESMAGFGESVLLLGIAGSLAVEAVKRLFVPEPVESALLGIWVMAGSSLGALLVGIYSRRVARQTRSLAIESNSQHLLVDFYTSVGVMVGLILINVFGWTWADPVVALLFVGWISWGAWRLSYRAFHELIDVRLPETEVEQVRRLVDEAEGVLSYHRLRTRRGGHQRYIDMHIVVPREWSVVEAHEVADRLEKRIARELEPANVVIHVDPYRPPPSEEG